MSFSIPIFLVCRWYSKYTHEQKKPVAYCQTVERTFYQCLTGNIFPQLSSEYTTRSATAADILLLTHIATIERTKPELPVSPDILEDI
jgi:hypothetical protein